MLRTNQGFNSKKQSNTNLLSILTKRQVNIHSTGNKNWPGKHAPNFILTSHKKNRNTRSQTVNYAGKQKSNQKSTKSLIRMIPVIRGSSSQLSLRPATQSKIKIISQFKSTKKQSDYFCQTQLMDKRPKTDINFRNKKLSNYLKEVDDNDLKRKTAFQIMQRMQYEKNFRIKGKQQNKLKRYEVQYCAFNFVGKVIDNPEKWGKFVRKKEIQDNFVTQFQNFEQ